MNLRVFSFGAGTQSTAVMVLAARGKVQYDHFLFANVGKDSENPATLRYVEQFAKPFAAKHGLSLIELRKVRRNGDEETLLQTVHRSKRSIPIPVRMPNGAPGTRRCTQEFKIEVVNRWLREHGATAKNAATVGIGISTDEIQRARSDTGFPYSDPEHPLLDLRMSRTDCSMVITSAGLPLPPKSACWFCPFMKPSDWRKMRSDNPVQFSQAVALESEINQKRETLGRDQVFLSPIGRPLNELSVIANQPSFDWQDGACDSGWCFT